MTSTGHASFVVFVVFPHENKLRDDEPIGCLQPLTRAAGERKNRFRGEHPRIQKRNDAGHDDSAFLERSGCPLLIHPVTLFTGKGGNVNLLTRDDFLDGQEPVAGMAAPGGVKPLLVWGEGRIVDEIGKRRGTRAGVLKQHRLKQHGADVFLIVVDNFVRKQRVHRLSQGVLVDRLKNKVARNFFAERFSAPLRVVRLAKAAERAGFRFNAGAERIVCEGGRHGIKRA